ncbi:2-succinylbenzoate--CoA ligase [Vibrio halioticoli NBRC 102217]|uniref:2-succinylbenzoate--CoA ligase n=1 Tax=Vibrio halioticoli NBRC 102217 TaxID=1219072 RepID=V5F098_9VIBR|nr:o-succinylbenzoate--CoA ligase [Vibrio halioticoli]GAD88529.1 2-succinylbenzoate--CoA ligase [Vibrio halioticoli NBRC 102217]
MPLNTPFSHQSPLCYWSECSDNKAIATSTSTPTLTTAVNGCALECNDGRYSWSELTSYVTSVRQQLLAMGLGDNDVLMLVTAHSSLQSIIVYLAALEAGIVVSIVPLLPKSELVKRQALLGCSYCYLCPSVEPELTGSIDTIYLEFTTSDYSSEDCSSSHSHFSVSNIASLIFTSGSTGDPKAVAHSVTNHLASAIGLQQQFSFDASSTWLLSLPLFHVSGLAIVWRWLLCGCCLRLKQGKGLNLQGVSHTSMVPTQLQHALQQIEEGTLQTPLTLQRVLLGGAIIPHSLANAARKYGIDTWAGYGLTEMASTVTAKRVDEADSAGQVLAKRAIKIDNQTILVAGETLAVGYWQKGILSPLAMHDGWFDTKDLGRWQNDELVIMGRADNLFISGGENIHCEEIERVLIKHSSIMQAFIVPVVDPTFGHRPVALLALSQGALNGELKRELNELCLSHLQKFKCPIDYLPIPSTLLNQGIKVSRSKLKNWLSEQHIERF